MTCVKPVQDLVSHNPSIVKKRVNTAPPQLRSCWHLRGYFFFYGYIDTGRLPIVFVKVSSALLKHLAINMGEEKIYFSLQPSGHTSLSWEVRAGTQARGRDEYRGHGRTLHCVLTCFTGLSQPTLLEQPESSAQGSQALLSIINNEK